MCLVGTSSISTHQKARGTMLFTVEHLAGRSIVLSVGGVLISDMSSTQKTS